MRQEYTSQETIDETQFFNKFIDQEIEQYDDDGEFIAVRKVRDMLHPSGEYADIDFLLNYAADEPSVHLEMVENDLLSALEDLRAVREAFEFELNYLHSCAERSQYAPDAEAAEEATLQSLLSETVVALTPDMRRMIASRVKRRSRANAG